MSRKLRIAYARVSQETNALSPLLTEIADFRRIHWYEGAELHWRTSPWGYEAPGFLGRAELSGFREALAEHGPEAIAIPLLSAWVIPGGPLSEACFTTLRDTLLARLDAAGPVDAVFLCLHGAMGAVGRKDPDGDLVRAVRDQLDARAAVSGRPRPLIAVTLDLHAALTAEMEALTDVLCAYRTNPHRDHAATGRRAGRLLTGALTGRIRPTAAWRSLPIVLGGGYTLDFLPPTRAVFARMKALEKQPGVLDCSFFTCHVWNDHPELGWGVHVVTDGDQALAERLADELADLAWEMRLTPVPEAPGAEEAIATVRNARIRRRIGTACVSDVSDVVGAGAPGENPRLVEALLTHAPDLLSYAPMRDDVAVAELWEQPIGASVVRTVGGRVHPALNPPLAVSGTLRAKRTLQGFGRVVVLDLGHVQLALTEVPPIVMKPAFYRDLGLEPLKADICVVKSFFPFRLFFAAENRLTVYARTRGVTDFDVIRDLDLHDPVHPVTALDDWRPVDRARRLRGAARNADRVRPETTP
jgi:microcystin degradation protein MlrC